MVQQEMPQKTSNRVITSAVEDYLKAIFELGGESVKTQALADSLGVSSASVTGMLKKLFALKLVAYERYRGVGLTEAGRQMALETIRHHRLIETYLAQALGYAWHEVHDEAEKLEHVISEDFEQRINAFLGEPTHDPHGDPIPRLDGTVPSSPGVPLSALEVGQQATINRITKQDREVLEYLASRGLVPGCTVRLLVRAPFKGPLTLEHSGEPLAIAFELADAIHADVQADVRG